MIEALNSPFWLILILLADFAITLLHTLQEWKGAGAPVWRNFGAIVGLEIPDRPGFWAFTFGLALILFVAGFVGITGRIGPPWLAAFALGGLIGTRLSDAFISHVLLYSKGYRPNPGLSSAPLYIVEALFLAFVFYARLSADPGWAIGGLVLGLAAFVLALPVLSLVRRKLPGLQRARWEPWQPVPAWTAINPSPRQARSASFQSTSRQLNFRKRLQQISIRVAEEQRAMSKDLVSRR